MFPTEQSSGRTHGTLTGKREFVHVERGPAERQWGFRQRAPTVP
jgi:hypothetical protein